MVFISWDFIVNWRIDLESVDVEVIWLEVCFYKLKWFIIFGSFYWLLFFKKDDDIKIEEFIERVYLLNKEIIIVFDINIDYKDRKNYDKYRFVKGLCGMNFK